MGDYPHGDTPPRSAMQKPSDTRDLRHMLDDDDVLYDAVIIPERTQRFAAAIDRGIKNGTPSILRIYRDIAQKIGRRFEVDAEVVHRLGVPLTEAQEAVRAMRGATGDPEEVYQRALEHVTAEARRRGLKLMLVPFQEGE